MYVTLTVKLLQNVAREQAIAQLRDFAGVSQFHHIDSIDHLFGFRLV